MSSFFAANHIEGIKEPITNGVVEIDNGIVKSVARLERETPFTIWLGGTIVLRQTELGVQAFKENKILL